MTNDGCLISNEVLKEYVDYFNETDPHELYKQYVPNKNAYDFLSENIPIFQCPDKQLEMTYYFRWWTYRKHIKSTEDGFVITEFLPKVPWAGKNNTINLTACVHCMEGRWLHNPVYLDDYSIFWYRKGGALRNYTSWLAYAVLGRAKVDGNTEFQFHCSMI